ncbi:OmpA family protein [Ferrimonas gelatinilytica]|uniref:OmpA family protein n=1 Tax=Ferrimonas gelatinilytica TaxID=1255257 RepID=A0ABP9RTC7_9GAMM
MKFIPTALCALLMLGCASEPVTDWGQTEQLQDLSDGDQDGVIMARENCVGSIQGAKVDNGGCGSVNEFLARRELKVLFPNNSSIIDNQYLGEIESVAEFLNRYPKSSVTIEGHCSKVGSREYNLFLSQRRADAVRTVLIQQFDIDAGRVKAIGYGFDRPVDSGDDPLAHSRNRRVIAELSTEDSEAAKRWTIWTVGR